VVVEGEVRVSWRSRRVAGCQHAPEAALVGVDVTVPDYRLPSCDDTSSLHPQRRNISLTRLEANIGIDVRGSFPGHFTALTRKVHTSMGHETNIDSIRALEKQIEEDKGDIIKLKRTRNSLLNISTRVPPEILGRIFVWILVRGILHSLDPFGCDHLREGPYDFLLVCHHWFEVACLTPELWSFWGNTLRDWKRRYRRSTATPIDLVLDGGGPDPGISFDESLKDAVRTRVIQGTIRRVHLTSNYGRNLTPIISSLTPNGEGSQNENIESIVWRNWGSTSVDVSDFFARSRLSKLRLLDLSGRLRISSWDRLASQATLLTALSLKVYKGPSPTPTTPRLLSILASNPNLQQLNLSGAAIPNDADGTTFQVPLHSLKVLALAGELRRLFGLLHRLILPDTLDEVSLTGFESTADDISQTLAPYMRDYFRRDARFQNTLRISSSFSATFISIMVTVCTQTGVPAQRLPRAMFAVVSVTLPPRDVREQLSINLIAPLPRERIVSFEDRSGEKLPEVLFFMMPNIKTLCIHDVKLSKGFLQPNPDGPRSNTKLLPSLRSLSLERVIRVNDGDLGHLTTYLAHQTSENQPISLRLTGYSRYLHPKTVDEIEGLVETFTYD